MSQESPETKSQGPSKRARRSSTQTIPSSNTMDKGKSKELPQGITTNPSRTVDKVISERTKRSWETRRRSAREGIENMVAVHGDVDENGAGPSTRPHSQDPSLSIPLPTSEFLLSVHTHASNFYMSNELLYQPSKKGRTIPWGSKKRLLILQDADGRGAGHDGSRSESGSKSNSKSRSTVSWRTAEDEDEEDELNDEEVIVKKEFVDEHGELILESRRGTSELDQTNGRKERSKGRYKKRDMYKAIEGDGLMAIGILLQQHIIRSVHTAGYRKPNPKATSDMNSPPTSTPKVKETKRKKRKHIQTIEEEEEREMESEEGQSSDSEPS
ncbi:hypothetical protein I302_103354 [Kwoniella bestiolae CBS 10118]|uniref:Uncharacterized protein n=1 Tax=Kwoniella bestiolae CBS 10118 TaxID=1296100 RepID=A0A1B9G866_9TREE|nr:hypothetical protein I302_02055 [Kwoniella bestiolae CBS 10118]OCF27216.1 hypothetical protein I302_02055 [Kwoniella bestiolae CBS 10118]